MKKILFIILVMILILTAMFLFYYIVMYNKAKNDVDELFKDNKVLPYEQYDGTIRTQYYLTNEKTGEEDFLEFLANEGYEKIEPSDGGLYLAEKDNEKYYFVPYYDSLFLIWEKSIPIEIPISNED